MSLLSKKSSSIKKAPSEEAFPIVNLLYSNKSKSLNLTTIGLSVVILDLIKKGYISCDIGDISTLKLSKKSQELSPKDLEEIAKINFRITKKQGDLKVSDKIAIDLIKNISNSKKFNLKQLYQRIIRPNVARTFVLFFEKWSKSIFNENDCSKLINDGNFKEYKENLKNWKEFKKYLKTNKDFEEDFLINLDDNLIYSCCLSIEDNLIKNLKNFDSNLNSSNSNTKSNSKSNSKLFKFIECGGLSALVIIFNAGIANNSEKDDDTGTFYGANNKGFVPGF